ncbi:MAG: IPTL-CTERM sorting domain-containing protein, partial [Planctomycetes bacterium]|nr:IPTL-CTERM sorting domain-containing protein [Planctomycetota bacterium]
WEEDGQAFLFTGTTYYLIVDGFGAEFGEFVVTFNLLREACLDDEFCDDGLFCNGAETCDTATGRCSAGTRPCSTYEGYTAPCDDVLGACVKPDDCFTWMADKVGSGYFFPESNHCPDLASWVFDDVQSSHHTTGVLDFYTTPIIARVVFGGSPVGTNFLVNQALFTVESGTCYPQAQIAGSQCTGSATIDPSFSPPHDLRCSGTMPLMPNNAGDFSRCEIDFFMAYRTTENGAGFALADNPPELGGPAFADEFGLRSFWLEDCPPTGAFFLVIPGDDNLGGDFATAVVCQKPGGSCCLEDFTCSMQTEEDCADAGGTYGGTGTINGAFPCGGDPDEDGRDTLCGDNCPDDFNPDQEDCNDDGEGDACEPEDEQDDDGDGVCNGVDNCPEDANGPGDEENQLDTDEDGVGDVCDPCPFSAPDDADDDGVCDDVDICLGFNDNADADGDDVPDGCDVCESRGPTNDDKEDGLDPDHEGIWLQPDDDNDGVFNCNDECVGVDDAVFAPDCIGKIPTVSEWGLVILALLLLVAGKVYFSRRESLA